MDFLYESRLMNTKLINENGAITDWEIKYVSINNHEIKIKDNEQDLEARSTIQLNSIIQVEEEIDLGPTINVSIDGDSLTATPPQSNESQILLKIKTSYLSPTMWILEMESQDMYDRWTNEIKKRSRLGKDVESQSPSKVQPYKNANNFKSSTKCGSISERGYKVWFSLFLIVYTAILVVLFSVLWVYYVSPLYGIDGVETTCKIDSSDWAFLSKGFYNYYLKATYTIESGEVLTNKAIEVCFGVQCTWRLDDDYPVGSNKTCHYDRDNVDFVYFDLSDTKYYRLAITFGLCGSLFFFWLIMVLFAAMLIRKRFKK